MPKTVTITATVRRHPKGFYEDIVVVTIAGVSLETKCKGPEHARQLVEKLSKELGLWNTSTD